MFKGQYLHTIDSKGRIKVPSKIREVLNAKDANKMILTKGLDLCISAYTLEEWQKVTQEVLNYPQTDSKVRAFNRIFIGSAIDCDIDRQGRMIIPANLREYAKIDKEIMIIGIISKLEIWSRELWLNYEGGAVDSYEDIAEHLGKIGM